MRQLFVLGIDGMPYSLLKTLSEAGELPALSKLAREGDLRQMDSVHPCVSSAAWTSFITGKQPGKHGLYGFVERAEGSYDVTIPLATTIESKNIWQVLSDAGKRVFGMNVPVTYPPVEVNGILIGDFLCPSLDKVARSPEVRLYLKSINYQIDSDPSLGRKSPDRMLRNLEFTLERRAQAMMHYLSVEDWSYFHAHIMETDRLFHFLYAGYLADDKRYEHEFLAFLRKVDDVVGRFVAAIPPDAGLVIASDHGFCPIKAEVQLARYLVEKGHTTPASAEPLHPLDISPARSRAYTLIPGRIRVNLRGREPGGIVPPEEFEAVRNAIRADLEALRAPAGDRVIRQVFMREELYWPPGARQPDARMPRETLLDGAGPFGRAPDLVAVPNDGYDLKMGLGASDVFMTTELEGMHTFGDAMILSRGVALPTDPFPIYRVARPLCEALGVAPPDDMD